MNKLLVIGIGGSYLGAKAGIDFIKGSDYDEVRFAGINVSADYFVKIQD
jgi:glucose-6-phosphate isomerase